MLITLGLDESSISAVLDFTPNAGLVERILRDLQSLIRWSSA